MITAIEPNVSLNGRYSVTEASALLGIDRKTLRNHALEGRIRFGIRRTNGRKFFCGRELLRYWKSES